MLSFSAGWLIAYLNNAVAVTHLTSVLHCYNAP
jgi:hypothetical protein